MPLRPITPALIAPWDRILLQEGTGATPAIPLDLQLRRALQAARSQAQPSLPAALAHGIPAGRPPCLTDRHLPGAVLQRPRLSSCCLKALKPRSGGR